jgi:hypothetical protein
VASASGVAFSALRFLRFLVSGKNPFFFRFMLMGLWVGTSLASFFSDLGRLGGSEQGKRCPVSKAVATSRYDPLGLRCPKVLCQCTYTTECAVSLKGSLQPPFPDLGTPSKTYWTPSIFMACQ